MLTTKQEDKLVDKIKGLSEIEMSHLIENMVEHMRKNNMMHLFDAYVDKSEIEDLESQISKLEEDLNDMGSEKDEALDDLSDAEEKLKNVTETLTQLLKSI